MRVSPATPEPLISTAEAAARIGRAEITLRKWRWRDDPAAPPYVRCGPHGIKYRPSDLDKWLESRTHRPGSRPAGKDRSPGRHGRRPGPR